MQWLLQLAREPLQLLALPGLGRALGLRSDVAVVPTAVSSYSNCRALEVCEDQSISSPV